MPNLQQLDRDWLNALANLQRAIEGQNRYIREIWTHFYPDFCSNSLSGQLVVSFAEPEDVHKLAVYTRHDWKELPEIERLEILSYVAASAYISIWSGVDIEHVLRGKRFGDALQNLCMKLGCYWVNNPDIRERWRLLDFYQTASQSPLAKLESRPLCRICHQPVATESGAWVKVGKEDDQQLVWELAYKDQVHDTCVKYVHRVLTPQEVGKDAKL